MTSNEEETGLKRRTYLGLVGAASASATIVGTAGASDGDYSRVVDIEEAGADSTGSEPIDDVFHDHAQDDTLIKFPEGTYKANQLSLYDLSQFAMVGDGATLVPGNDYDESWIAGMAGSDVRIENFTLDTTGSGVHPTVDVNVEDGLVVRNVTKKGYHDAGGVGMGFYTRTSDGTALLENITATDGGECVGIYIQSEGPVTVRNCHIEGFVDNGLYGAHSEAPVKVEGGRFWNNNVAQVRLGSADSYVRDAEIGVDRKVPKNGSDRNMRGIRISDGPGPVTIENCDIWMKDGEGSGAIVGAYSGGTFHVRDTRIYVDENYTTIGSDGSRTSYGVFVDGSDRNDPGERTIERTSITGGGTLRGAMRFERDNNTIQDCCVQQSGNDRNGFIFEESDDNEVANSTINVSGQQIVLRDSSARRAANSDEGSCPAPGQSSDDAEDTTQNQDSGSVAGDVGTVTHERMAGGHWHTVEPESSYDSPVAIMKPLSFNDPEPAHVRLRGVSGDEFQFSFEEWTYLDREHKPETAHYLFSEAGTYTIGDVDGDAGVVSDDVESVALEAGTFRTDDAFTGVSFDADFGRTPVVFTQPQSYVGEHPIVTRVQDVSTSGFAAHLDEEEGEVHGGSHKVESVGYVAIEPGAGTVFDRAFEVDATDTTVNHNWHRIEFERSYDNPRFIADIQSHEGPNTANLRYRNLTDSGVEVRIQEETSEDSETSHRDESVGYLVIEGSPADD